MSEDAQKLKILIIEDDEEIRKLLAEFLQGEGYHVQQANNGTAALEILRENSFDIIFTDWDMADINGCEICQHVRRSNQRVFIVVTSGWSLESLSVDLGSKLFDQFIKKPFGIDKIIETVESAKSIVRQRDNNHL